MPISAPDLSKYGWLHKGYQCITWWKCGAFSILSRKEKKRKEKKSACSGWWPERPWGMITVFSSQLSPVLHFPPHRPGAQDKSQQAQMLATCQMLLGLRLPALSIWLATLAVSHLLLNQHFLVNNLIGREITITFFIFVDSNIISLIRMSVSHE